tara:strand:+ start:593 stop:889 length:297 start_codon:yes stop_codon:yes gene_type:complete
MKYKPGYIINQQGRYFMVMSVEEVTFGLGIPLALRARFETIQWENEVPFMFFEEVSGTTKYRATCARLTQEEVVSIRRANGQVVYESLEQKLIPMEDA